MSLCRRILHRLHRPRFDGIAYWQQRAQQYGVRSVLNINHTPQDTDAVTQMQVRTLFPILQALLKGDEQVILDYGCGPGRFTARLAELIHGGAVGVDPIQHLLDLAPNAPNVTYQCSREGRIPLHDHSFDIVWICLVLGGILEKRQIRRAINEIRRVLKPGGLLFLIENTTAKPSAPHWAYRSAEQYQAMFPFVSLRPQGSYEDCSEKITVLAGRTRYTT